jgi:hypothetical protein
MTNSEKCAKCSNRFNRHLCNYIFSIEDKLKIRRDFILFYSNAIPNAKQSIRQKFTSVSQYNYYTQIANFSDYIDKYDPKKKSSKSIKFRQDLKVVNDIFSFIDSILTFLAIPGFSLLSIAFFVFHFPFIISIVSAILCLIMILLNLISNFMIMNAELMKGCLQNLFVRMSDLNELNLSRDKETVIGVYLWDFSICSTPYETIKGFLLLLLVKSLSERIYKKVISGFINLVPLYINEYPKNRGFIQRLQFAWTNRKKF